MNPEEYDDWKEELLVEIFYGLSEHQPLQSMLVFKGARVLNELLHEVGRRSLDIDSNLWKVFVESTPDRSVQQEKLEKELRIAISRHFDRQSPVRYSLDRIKVDPRPKEEHPRGWDAYDVRITVVDHARPAVRGLPTLKLDIAAPEALSDGSIAPLRIGTGTIFAYTLERIAGEKMRAFLSSLPSYRNKMKKPGNAVRVKDIFDIARISDVHPIDDNDFWSVVGDEFRLACRSRFVDCLGIDSFEQDLVTTEFVYDNDPTLPDTPKFSEAWNTIRRIVTFLEGIEIIPFEFPCE